MRTPAKTEEIRPSSGSAQSDNSLLLAEVVDVQPIESVESVELVVEPIVRLSSTQTHSNISSQTVASDVAINIEDIMNKVADRCRDEVVETMKEQFTIFSNRLTINDQEISHVSSRVDLLWSRFGN